MKNFSQNPQNFVKSEKTISWIKSFELKIIFLNGSSVSEDEFFDKSAGIFLSKIRETLRKWTFSSEGHFLQIARQDEGREFRQSFRELLGERMTLFMPKFQKKRFLG